MRKLFSTKLRKLVSDQSGNTVIEFAVIAPTFMLLLMGTFDIGHRIYVRSALDGALQQAARNTSLQTGTDATARAAIDTKVRNIILNIAPQATVTAARKNFLNYTHVKRAENYTDTNADGVCNNNEPFVDENSNGIWDDNVGASGVGGARDAVEYQVTVRYDRLFPVPGFGDEHILIGRTLLKNQPYGSQAARTTANGNCS